MNRRDASKSRDVSNSRDAGSSNSIIGDASNSRDHSKNSDFTNVGKPATLWRPRVTRNYRVGTPAIAGTMASGISEFHRKCPPLVF